MHEGSGRCHERAGAQYAAEFGATSMIAARLTVWANVIKEANV